MLHPRVSTHSRKSSRSCGPRSWHPWGLQGGPVGDSSAPHWEYRAVCAALAQGTACPANILGLGFRGEEELLSPCQRCDLAGRIQVGCPGVWTSSRAAHPSPECLQTISAASRANVPCLGFKLPPEESLMLKSKAPALGVRCEELVGPL